MKATIIGLLTGLLLCTGSADSQCLQNGDFASYCGTDIDHGCPTFDHTCALNWSRSHGTPQIIVPGPQAANNLCYMWGTKSNIFFGEGVFASFNFINHETYKIKIRAHAVTPTSGQFFLYATNNMVESPLSPNSCGDPLPTVTSKEQIVQLNNNTGWTEYTIYFTPTSDYSQIWIYPYTTSNTQFNLYLDYVFICPNFCTGTVIYNNGQVTSGDTKTGYIGAGSTAGTGGTGTVTVAADQTTTFIGAQEIQLLPEFSAAVTTGQFIAKIVQPCDSSTNASAKEDRIDIDVSQFPTDPLNGLEEKKSKRLYEVESLINKNRFSLYPNPSTGRITINPNIGLGASLSIEVYDGTGRMILQKKDIHNTNLIWLDLSHYKTGYYFIKLISKNSTKIDKIFIRH